MLFCWRLPKQMILCSRGSVRLWLRLWRYILSLMEMNFLNILKLLRIICWADSLFTVDVSLKFHCSSWEMHYERLDGDASWQNSDPPSLDQLRPDVVSRAFVIEIWPSTSCLQVNHAPIHDKINCFVKDIALWELWCKIVEILGWIGANVDYALWKRWGGWSGGSSHHSGVLGFDVLPVRAMLFTA